jgi:hypothetical protein
MTAERDPRFPPVPDGYWTGSSTHAGRSAFLDGARKWRADALHWLEAGSRASRLSAELSEFMRWALGDPTASPQDAGPYHVSSFPTGALRPGARETDTVDVLVWRARLVDMLADVWDTLGPARFEIEECREATRVLMPDETRGRHFCPYCLDPESPSADPAAHDANCPIQRNVLTTGWDESGEP